MGQADPPRRLGRGKAKKVYAGRCRVFAERSRLRKQCKARAARDKSRQRGERFRSAMHLLHSPHQARAQHLVGKTMAVSQREQWTDVGPRQVCGPQVIAQ